MKKFPSRHKLFAAAAVPAPLSGSGGTIYSEGAMLEAQVKALLGG
jgi:hypothetical protein